MLNELFLTAITTCWTSSKPTQQYSNQGKKSSRSCLHTHWPRQQKWQMTTIQFHGWTRTCICYLMKLQNHPRTQGLRSSWSTVWETSDPEDLKSENIGLPVELHMPSFQKPDQQAFWCFTSARLYCFSSQSDSIRHPNFRESVVLSSLCSK